MMSVNFRFRNAWLLQASPPKAELLLLIKMEEKLRTLYDVSGACIISTDAKQRPRMGRKECVALGYDWPSVRSQGHHADSMMRHFFFEMNPGVDKNHSIVYSCGDIRCVNVAHARVGLWNPARGKYWSS